MNSTDFSYVCCWTCAALVYDVAVDAYRCVKTGKKYVSKYAVNRPTNCPDWEE